MDLFVVPTIGFNLLYAFVIIRLDPQRPCLDQRYNKSDRGVDRAPDNGGLSMG